MGKDLFMLNFQSNILQKKEYIQKGLRPACPKKEYVLYSCKNDGNWTTPGDILWVWSKNDGLSGREWGGE